MGRSKGYTLSCWRDGRGNPHQLRESVWTFRSGFSNFECNIDELIDDGMRVAVRWTWSEIHTGSLLGIAPTNRKIEFTETHPLRISGDRIAEDHVYANLLDLLGQLGTTQFAAA